MLIWSRGFSYFYWSLLVIDEDNRLISVLNTTTLSAQILAIYAELLHFLFTSRLHWRKRSVHHIILMKVMVNLNCCTLATTLLCCAFVQEIYMLFSGGVKCQSGKPFDIKHIQDMLYCYAIEVFVCFHCKLNSHRELHCRIDCFMDASLCIELLNCSILL